MSMWKLWHINDNPMKTTPTTTNLLRNEKGETLFYTIVCVPILFGFCMLFLDLSAWQSLRQYLQKEGDRIILTAAQFLPDEARVGEYINSELALLAELKDKNLKNEIQIDSSSVSLQLSADSPSFFDVFLTAASGKETALQASHLASASILPSDYVLILSDAASLRPAAYNNWGETKDWPASSYFRLASAPILSSEEDKSAPLYWPNWWKEDFNTETFQRWATEQCFNPYYSPFKFAAMSLADKFISEDVNRLSLLFTPGDLADHPGFSIARGLEFNDGSEKHNWSNYFEQSSATSDEACVYFSSEKTAKDGEYLIPDILGYVSTGTDQTCEKLYNTSPFEDGFGYLPNPSLNRLSSCFTGGGAGIQELIYFHAARSHYHSPAATNIILAIEYALFSLAQTSEHVEEEIADKRGNLSNRARKEIIVLADDLPAADNQEFLKLLAKLSDFPRFRLTYVVYAHDGLSKDKREQLSLNFERLNAEQSSNFELYYVDEPSQLEALSLVLQKKSKQIALRV